MATAKKAAAVKVFPVECAAAVTAYVSKQGEAETTKLSMVESFNSKGITPMMLKAPVAEKGKKKPESPIFEGLKKAVVAGFTKAAQHMLTAEQKSLPDVHSDIAAADRQVVCKVNREYHQMQIGSKCKDVRNQLIAYQERLAKAEKTQALIAEGKPVPEAKKAVQKSWEVTALATVSTLLKQSQNREGTTCDLFKVQALLKDLQVALSAKVAKPAKATKAKAK